MNEHPLSVAAQSAPISEMATEVARLSALAKQLAWNSQNLLAALDNRDDLRAEYHQELTALKFALIDARHQGVIR